jgi:predicted AAA+ superfamily ATPase
MPVGRVDFQFVRPFCFKEFLKARKRFSLLQVVDDFVSHKSDYIPQAAHDELISELSQYVFVGGMLESLARFVDAQTLASGMKLSRTVQNRILIAYRDELAITEGESVLPNLHRL